MKSIYIRIVFVCALQLSGVYINAQICLNNTDSLYGLNSITGSGSGQIVSINVHNAGAVTIGSPASGSANANGLAFCSVSNKFYFFNQCGSGTTEFVSYDPLTGSKVPLAIPVPAIPIAQKIRSGAMTADGFAYYTIYPGATTAQGFPSTNPAFFYYNVGTNSWTLITQKFKDVTNHIVTEFKSVNSGDMAFDGSGNLWVVTSNAVNYALYRIRGPLPVIPVDSLVVDTILSLRPTPAGVSITGIAFNSEGKLFLSTGSYTTPPGVAGNNQLYEMIEPSLPLTNIGTLPNGYGDDLTSCAIPYYVLSENDVSLEALFKNTEINIKWQNKEEGGVKSYELEYSKDGSSWAILKSVTELTKAYSFNHTDYTGGYNFYRVAMILHSGQRKYSNMDKVFVNKKSSIQLGPNPAGNSIRLYSSKSNEAYTIDLFDNTGRLLRTWEQVMPGELLDLAWLKPGMYIARVIDRRNKTTNKNLRIVKE